ncbi:MULTISPECIES: hypothetical protein [unclassified Streptomyces]|uniref:hypothetical protein n=1 Tax=unclassified Streptomyces TaxID=2593676 RepID=UPI001F3CDAB8|nr:MULTISPECIES: hypothetical protein [unclassified Streptomyces]WKX21291.1 hypothetical protein Q3Y68_25930 [Streptomyces sp. HUAS CX7]
MSDTTGEPGTVPGRDVHAERGDVHADRGHFNTERGADRTTTDPRTAAAPGATTDPGTGVAPDTAAAPGAAADSDGITPAPAPSETAAPQAPPAADRPLLPPTDSGRLGERLHHALAGFVDAPRASVEEADRVLEEITARFTEAVTHRRQTLRASWREPGEGAGAPSTDTEQLRLALRDYRELAGRLMRL